MQQFRLTWKQYQLLARATPVHVEAGEARIEHQARWNDSTDSDLRDLVRHELIFPEICSDDRGQYVVLTPRGEQFRTKAIELIKQHGRE